jgi:hypothetical protein
MKYIYIYMNTSVNDKMEIQQQKHFVMIIH